MKGHRNNRVSSIERHLSEIERAAESRGEQLQGEIDVLEKVIEAELAAHAAVRAVMASERGQPMPLVPPNSLENLRELQALTRERGEKWRARLDRILSYSAQRPHAEQLAEALQILRPLAVRLGGQ